MAARVQIVVEASDAASGVLRAITSQFGAMGGLIEELTAKNVSWGNVAERATSMVIEGLKASIDATVEYAEAVRDQSLASGQSAEEASRFLQVLDDYQLTAEDAKAATRALTKDGLAPTVETLIQLSAEYQNLATAEEKNAFVQEKLGRSGQAWLNLLDQGPDKIKAMNDAVAEKLILTDKDIAATEEYRLALDELGDATEAAKISLGTKLLPVLTDLMKGVSASQRAWEILEEKGIRGANVWGKDYADALAQAKAEQVAATAAIDATTQSLDPATRAMSEYGAAAEETAVDLKELEQVNAKSINAVIELTEAHRDYAAKQDEVSVKIKNLQAEKAKLYPWEKTKLQEIDGQLDELNKSYAKNAEEFRKAMNKKLASMALEKIAMLDGVAGFNAAEMKKAEAILTTLDVATRSAFEEQLAMETITEAVSSGEISVQEYGKIVDRVMADGVVSIHEVQTALNNLPTEKTITLNWINNGAPPPNYEQLPLCFAKDTYVRMGDGSEKPIQDIRVGDVVAGYDLETGKHISAVVEKTFFHTPAEMQSGYYLLINDRIAVTPEHPFWANGKWVTAGSLKAGDELLGYSGQTVVVMHIRWIYKRVETYNLHVSDKNHNYFAGDVLVHNKLQSGGVAYAGVPTMVGEAGAEPFFPAVNGRVIGHAEALHALSLGVGGGNIGPFYGNVTLEISEGEAGMLSMR